MYSRFQDIHHALIGLGERYTDFDIVSKVLNSLTDEWERKVLAIEEANDLSTMKPEELIGNLMSYEVNMQAKKDQAQERKNVAFHAEKEESESEDEDLAFIAKNFKKFLRYRKGNKNGFKKNFLNKPSSSNIECFNCHKKGHMQKDCQEQMKENQKSFNNKNKKDKFKKKAFSVTWDDSDSSSSENDSDSDNEQANVCFMAQESEVNNLTFDDLIEVNTELLNTIKTLKKKLKETRENQNKAEFERDMLKDEKKILEEELEKFKNLI